MFSQSFPFLWRFECDNGNPFFTWAWVAFMAYRPLRFKFKKETDKKLSGPWGMCLSKSHIKFPISVHHVFKINKIIVANMHCNITLHSYAFTFVSVFFMHSFFRHYFMIAKCRGTVVWSFEQFWVDGEECEVVEIFPVKEDRKYGDSKIFRILFQKLKLLWILGAKKCTSLVAHV